MTTKELAALCGVHPTTILRLAGDRLIDGDPMGGRHGWDFDEEIAAPQVRKALAKRHRDGVRKRLRTLAAKEAVA